MHVGASASRSDPVSGLQSNVSTINSPQPIKLAILAMGGEGGGVLADWIVDLGEYNGHLAQTTSVPGVAQRTGATIYYVELFPADLAEAAGRAPVFALMPLPGDVDVVLASELMEAGRAVQRGLVTADRTTLIASTHRVYSIAEKSAMGDGRVDSARLLLHAQKAARRFIHFDMAEQAERSGSVISAVLFGALAGSGVLPFSRTQFEATIERGGLGVKASLAAFGAAYELAQRDAEARADARAADELKSSTTPNPISTLSSTPTPTPTTTHPAVRALVERIRRHFPQPAWPVLHESVRRLIDYQDLDYASRYLDRLARMAVPPAPQSAPEAERLLIATARHLALWMSYEDTARVADLKTRGSRFERVKGETRLQAGQLIGINEYMHPRLQEICETLPAGLGRWLMASTLPRRLVERLTRQGRVVETSSLHGFLLLRCVASARRWRRSTLRFQQENGLIDEWLLHINDAAAINPALAVEIAECQRLVKGYSDTHERGLRNYRTVMAAARRAGSRLAPATLRELCDAALADEEGRQLGAMLARHALAG